MTASAFKKLLCGYLGSEHSFSHMCQVMRTESMFFQPLLTGTSMQMKSPTKVTLSSAGLVSGFYHIKGSCLAVISFPLLFLVGRTLELTETGLTHRFCSSGKMISVIALSSKPCAWNIFYNLAPDQTWFCCNLIDQGCHLKQPRWNQCGPQDGNPKCSRA